MPQGFTIIPRGAGGRCLHNRSSCCQPPDACTSRESTFSPRGVAHSRDWYLDLHELNAVTLMPWRAYLNTPPRRRSVGLRSRPTPPMHSHPVEVSSSLLLAPVMRKQVRPVSQARNLFHSQIPSRLSLLYPERLNIQMFNPARAIPHNNALRRRAVCQKFQFRVEAHLHADVAKGQALRCTRTYCMKLGLSGRQGDNMLSSTPLSQQVGPRHKTSSRRRSSSSTVASPVGVAVPANRLGPRLPFV